MILKSDIKDIYGLSPMQKGILFHYELNHESTQYVEQAVFEIIGSIDITAFEEAFNMVIQKHDSFRSIFIFGKGKRPLQGVLKERRIEIFRYNIQDKTDSELEEYMKEFCLNDREKGFNLKKDVLLRISVVDLKPGRYKIIWTFHHIIMDGWCLGIIMKDFFQFYESILTGNTLDKARISQYSEYIKWLKSKNSTKAMDYWKNYLDQYDTSFSLPADISTNMSGYEMGIYEFKLKDELAQKIQNFASDNLITMNSIFQTLWGILVSKYNNVEDIVFGTVVSGRPASIANVDSIVGLFINTIPTRVKYNSNVKLIDIIKNVQKQYAESIEYSYVSLNDIQAGSSVKRDLISNIVVFENYPINEQGKNIIKKIGLDIAGNIEFMEETNYNLEFTILPHDGIILRFRYNKNLYSAAFMSRLEQQITKLLEDLYSNPEIALSQVNLITEEESNKIIHEFIKKTDENKYFQTIHKIFEEQVEQSANKIAITDQNTSLTYGELNTSANQLARALQEQYGVKKGDFIGIHLERSNEFIISVLAVLKLGAICVPIDRKYPVNRIQSIMNSCSISYILTTNYDFDINVLENIKVDISKINLEKYSSNNLMIDSDASEPAYVIFTSGSTGQPKGVLINHDGIVNHAYTKIEESDLQSKDICCHTLNFSFVASIWLIFAPLFRGSKLHIYDEEKLIDINRLFQCIDENNITILEIVPSVLQAYLQSVDLVCNKANLTSLKKILLTGEKVEASLVNSFYERYSIELINAYGQSECSDDTLHYHIPFSTELEKVLIGKPSLNTQVYIMDKHLQMLPIGVIGEICISGVGVTKGYMNNFELTKEKFVVNPLFPNERLFRTGDLGRWLPDGNVEYIGRVDHQIKIRGYRIELEEIEHVLLHKANTKGVVIAKQDKNGFNQLYAFIEKVSEFHTQEVKNILSNELPDYMIPAYFIELEEFLYNQNGKVDRRKLYDLIDKLEVCGEEYEPPTNIVETKLVKIWKDILEVKNIGINNNFLDLGGHSLKGMALIANINKEFEVEIPLKVIFSNPTIKGIAEIISMTKQSDYEQIQKADISDFAIVSSSQKRMYLLQNYDRETTSYNMPWPIEINGNLDIDNLKVAIYQLIRRHESLRTSFYMLENEIYQKIETNVDFEMEYLELSSAEEIDEAIHSFIRHFELQSPPLFRVRLLKIEATRYILVLDMHHIISDGLSMFVLFKDLIDLYHGQSLEELKIQYKDYAVWQNTYLHSDIIQENKKYWMNQFEDEIPVLNLPTDYARPIIQKFDGDKFEFNIDEEITQELNKIASLTGSTMFMVLLSSVYLLLSKYSGQEDIVIGIPIAGRTKSELENLVGLFINTLAIRTKIDGNATFKEFLLHVKEKCIMGYENQDYQFEELVEELNIYKDTSRNPLFDVMFTLEDFLDFNTELGDVEFKKYELKQTSSKFDLTFAAMLNQGKVHVQIEYSTSLFKDKTILSMSENYMRLLRNIVKNSEIKIAEIDILSLEEKEAQIYEFNNTIAQTNYEKSIILLFEEQVEKTPENIAIEFKKTAYTYDELNKKVNKVARFLKSKNIQKNDIIGLLMDNSVELLVSILAILKIGATYVPIDPEYPLDRIRYIMSKSCMKKLLVQNIKEIININENLDADIEVIERPELENMNFESTNLNENIDMNALAYIIFTSGSTGNPKGVMISHKNLMNYLLWGKETYVKDEKLNFPLYSSISFDLTVTSIYLPLMTGNTIIIYNAKEKSTLIEEIVMDNRVDIIKLTPSHLELMIEHGCKGSRIRKIIVGGELFKTITAKKIYDMLDGKVDIYNEYGPTEATVGCMIYRYEEVYSDNISVPIGVPIDNTQIYILDKYHNPVIKGARGEIYIGGDSLSKGYINDELLTEEKFISNPFIPNSLMYKTGDIGRVLESGIVEYIGRTDEQIKLRGFRIEIGEIENKIKQNSQITNAVVILKKDRQKNSEYLCAYITGKELVDIQKLKERLLEQIPRYMIPSYFIQLDSIPVTNNGKVDIRNLPEPNENLVRDNYVSPTNSTEEKLVLIWEEILGISKIGIHDNFFELGGHSLKATRLVTEIYKIFGIKLFLKDVFQYQTIKELSEFISKSEKEYYDEIPKIAEKEYYEVSSAQKRMYIMQMLDQQSINYNIPKIFSITGELNKERLEQSVLSLINRHEILRTSFHMSGEKIKQKVNEYVPFTLEYQSDLDEKQLKNIFTQFVQPFDLSKAPLLRLKLINTKNKQQFLALDIHHIITDAISSDILISELSKIYCGEQLKDIDIQYKDYAEWQYNSLDSKQVLEQKMFWKEKLGDELPILNLPTDYKRTAIQDVTANSVTYVLDKEYTDKLKDIATTTQTTLFMVLLTAINIVLSKHTDQDDIIVGTPIAGRKRAEFYDIVGLFVNTLVLRNHPTSIKEYKDFIDEIKQSTLESFENQDYPFDNLVEELNIAQDTGRNAVFDIMFSMINYNNNIYQLDGCTLEDYKEIELEAAKFDLTFFALEQKDTIELTIQYRSALYKFETVERILNHLVNVIKNIYDDMNQTIGNISLLSNEDVKKILEFNNTYREYPNNSLIIELFEQQVQSVPDKIALVCEDKFLTYQELNNRANSVALHLLEKNIGLGDMVAILSDNSIEIIISILAILKVGAVYLPISTQYPTEWIHFVLEDCNTSACICDKKHMDLIPKIYNTIIFDELDNDKFDSELKLNKLTKSLNSDALAYVMYTSGTTGRPKGIMVSNKNIIRLVKNTNYISFDQDDKILQTSNFAFDASTFEIWGALLNGIELHLRTKEQVLNSEELCKYINNNNISTMWMTSGLYNLTSQVKPEMFSKLKTLLLGGEALSPYHVNLIKDRYPNLSIYNMYGPTENTTFSTHFKIDKKYDMNVPIGKPISNSKVYILDKNDQLLPIGICGEIYLAGDGLAKGYINNEKLTNEKFVYKNNISDEILYKTGDLGRWLPDGNIEYLGRADKQVKIRGFRIEIEEIEHILLSFDFIKEAIVKDRMDNKGFKYLCAYVVSDSKVDINLLMSKLKSLLPEYMIPSHFIQIDSIPLTNNGKLDENELYKINGVKLISEVYETPRNELEEILVEIWCEVLEVKELGINANFFQLGGHSLKAIALQQKINEILSLDLPYVQIFTTPTIRELSEFISTIQEQHNPIKEIETREFYQLSSAQKRMYLLQEFDKKSVKYNMPQVLEITGDVDIKKLENSLHKLVKRHEALRTSFHMLNDEIVQKIHDNVELTIPYMEVKDDKSLEDILSELVVAFDLAQAPLFRACIIKRMNGNHLLFVDMHHIISDGFSIQILFKDLFEIYGGLELEEKHIQYKDFAYWEASMLQSQKIKESRQYWINKFSGEIPVLDLATDYTRPKLQSFEGDIIDFVIDGETTSALKKLAKDSESTMFVVLLSNIAILLSKYSRQEDIIIGTTVHARPKVELLDIVGMFVNTLAIRNMVDANVDYQTLLTKIKKNCIEAFEHGDYPFDELVNDLNLHRDVSRNPIFDVMFTMSNELKYNNTVDGLEIKAFDKKEGISKFDLTFSATEYDDSIIMSIEYCTKLFNKDTIIRMIDNLKHLLKVVCNNSNILIEDIQIANENEINQIMYGFNPSPTNYQKEKTISEVFEDMVKKIPDKRAVVYENESLTYKQLSDKVEQLAYELRKRAVGPNIIVGILMGKSIEMIIAILGVLRAGGAYLPIDIDIPEHRKEFIIEDSNMSILLTTGDLTSRIEEIVDIIDIKDIINEDSQIEKLEFYNNVTDMAYIIYTSGSTGKPKGVMVEHRNVLHVSNWYNNKYNVSLNKNVLHITNIGFDVAVLETLIVVMNGGTIFIPKKNEIYDKDKFKEYVNKYKIQSVQFVPETLKQLVVCNEKMDSLNILISGGDVLEGTLVKEILDMGYNIYNHYGPTETTVDTIATSCGEQNIIGKPVENSKVYILDEKNRIMPIGVPGEICIGGDGVTRGYLNNVELTNEKFIQDPYNTENIIYKTGDMGRWLSDGNIQFMGRMDSQVKIRGIRIELGEIEYVLKQHVDILDAVVITRKDNGRDKYLCAYIISKVEISTDMLRDYLYDRLPDYMIPTAVVQMKVFPLNSNKKVDKKSLPQPTIGPDDNKNQMPTNSIEEKIKDVWCDVFKYEYIGINEDFFEIGGHSLKASTIIARLNRIFEVEIPLVEIFNCATIKKMAQYIQNAQTHYKNTISKAPIKDYYKLSKAQKRLFILHQLNNQYISYNMPITLRIFGSLDVSKLESTIQKIINKHEVLRTSFKVIIGEAVQIIHQDIKIKIETIDLDSSSLENKINQLITPFDLAKPPLMRVFYLKNNKEEQFLLIDMHHIISDGLSIDILFNEIIEVYSGKEVKSLDIQYKDFAEWQYNDYNTEKMERLEAFWMKKMKGFELTKLQSNYLSKSNEGDNVDISINKEISDGITQLCKRYSVTRFSFYTAILDLILMYETGSRDITIGTPVSGRNSESCENIIGLFLNLVILRVKIDENKDYIEYLKDVNNTIIEALDNQEYPYEELYSAVRKEMKINTDSLFSIFINYVPYTEDIIVEKQDQMDFSLEYYNIEQNSSKYDMTVYVDETNEGDLISIVYKKYIFEKFVIERIATSFYTLAKFILDNENITLKEIDYSLLIETESDISDDDDLDSYYYSL